eukprot:COSAG05_NODE_17128_length_331_cov_0.931034_1_plen_36_part_01
MQTAAPVHTQGKRETLHTWRHFRAQCMSPPFLHGVA